MEIDSDISSQFISGLIMIAPHLPNGLEIILKNNVVSYQFIELTQKMCLQFGIVSEWNKDTNIITIPNQTYTNPEEFIILGDATAASYLICLSILHKFNLYIPNLDSTNLQGDLYYSTKLLQSGEISKFQQIPKALLLLLLIILN